MLPLAACNLYFEGGDDGDPCDYGGNGGEAPGYSDPVPEQNLRNPYTGQCEYYGGGGGPYPPYPCNSECGPCAEDVPAYEEESAGDRAPQPTWGFCQSYCTGLDEGSCLATDGCRGIYSGDRADGHGQFMECWQTDQSGDVDYDTCANLDAFSCSRSDACSAVHNYACDDNDSDGLFPGPCVANQFAYCLNEKGSNLDGCYSDTDCDVGESCNADEICLPGPGNGSGNDGASPAVCYGYCVADSDPGECDGDVYCEAAPPACPTGTTPGISNGCWTGECIPVSECPQTSCEDIQSEYMCIATNSCLPYYVGENCTCSNGSCTCESWDFQSCHTTAP